MRLSARLSQSVSRTQGPRFDAFISYSHQADKRVAAAIQAGLHQFAKPWFRLRALHLFRDDATLATTPALWPSLVNALDDSRYLLLFASPESASSPWVTREVLHWLQHKSADHLLIVLTAGNLSWSNESTDFDWSGTDALPQSLKGAFKDEPRYLDLRWARESEHLTLREPKFQDAVAELAAPLRGVPKDTIVGEDVKQHRRTTRLARSAVAALSILLAAAITAGALALVQRNTARIQRDLALSRQLASAADLTRAHSFDLSLLLSLHALRFAETPEAEAALLRGLQATAGINLILPSETGSGNSFFSPDGQTLVVASASEVQLRDAETGDVRATIGQDSTRGYIAHVAMSPNSDLVAIGQANGTVQLWSAREQKRLGSPFSGLGDQLLPYTGESASGAMRAQAINAVAFDEEGKELVAVDGSARLFVWPVNGGNVGQPRVFALPDMRFGASSVQHLGSTGFLVGGIGAIHLVSPGGTVIPIHKALKDSLAKVQDPWMQSTYMSWTRLPAASPPPLPGATLAIGGQITRSQAAGTVAEGTIALWRYYSDKPVNLLRTQGEHAVHVTAISQDGKLLAAGDDGGTVWVWDLRTLRLIEARKLHAEGVTSVAFHPTRPLIASTGGGSLVVRNLKSVQRLIPRPETREFLLGARRVTYSSDGRLLATGYTDGTVVVRDATSSKQLLRVALDSTEIRFVAFARGPLLLFAATAGGWVGSWSLQDSLATPVIRSRLAQRVDGMAITPDGRFVAISDSTAGIAIWSGSLSDSIGQLKRPSNAKDLVLDSTGSFLFSNSNGWTLERHRLTHGASGPFSPATEQLHTGASGGITALALGADGERVVIGGYSGDILTASLATWKVERTQPPNTSGSVTAIAVSPDGRRIASTAGRQVRLWDSETLRPIGEPITIEEGPLWDAAFSPDGQSIAIAVGNGAVVLIDASRERWLQRACQLARRELTAEEWAQFVSLSVAPPSVCSNH